MKDERIQIRISEDGMSALASVTRGPPAGAGELGDALDRAGVSFGVSEAALRRLSSSLRDEEFTVRDLVIASGRPAVQSRDAGFEPAFQVGVQPGRLRDDGSMDFFDRSLLKAASQGDVLGRVVPARRERIPGVRVDGTPQPATHMLGGMPQFGPGVALQAGGSVVATRSGTISYRASELLDVVEQYVHAGDVDLRSGHLCSEGSLVIAGDVKRMFGVRALGDLEIHGVLESGSVYAGGSILLHGSASGGAGGIVSAGKDVHAAHAERIEFVCGGALTLTDAAYCELEAKTITVLRSLRGGKASAETSINVEQAGSANGKSDTLLIAGNPLVPPELPAQPIIVQIKHELVTLPMRESERPLSASSMVMLASRPPARTATGSVHPSASPRSPSAHPGAAGSTAPHSQSSLPRTASASHPAQRSTTRPPAASDDTVQAAAERTAAQHAHLQHLREVASIQVFGVAHAGVIIQIGDARLMLDQPMHNVRFTLDAAARKIRTSTAQR